MMGCTLPCSLLANPTLLAAPVACLASRQLSLHHRHVGVFLYAFWGGLAAVLCCARRLGRIENTNAEKIPATSSTRTLGSGVIVLSLKVDSIVIGTFPAKPISAEPQFPELCYRRDERCLQFRRSAINCCETRRAGLTQIATDGVDEIST